MEIFMGLVSLCSEHEGAKTTMAFGVLSGVFSFGYNIIQFTIVHTLSPSATAFSGNFNKAALVFLTLLLPFLQVHALPGPPYIYVIWASVIGNVVAFSFYSYLQILEKQQSAQAAHEQKAREALLDVEDGFQEADDEEEQTSSSEDSDSKVC